MLYAYNPTAPLPTLTEVEFENGQPGDEVLATYLAEQYPEVIYFEYTPPPTQVEQAETAVADFLATIRTPGQYAFDIAVVDLISALNTIAQEG